MIWRAHDFDRLQELWPQKTIPFIAAELGRSPSSIRSAIDRLKLRRHHINGWTAEEIAYIEAHWQDDPASAIGEKLGRSRSAISGKIHRLRRCGTELERKPQRLRPRQVGATVNPKPRQRAQTNQMNQIPKAKPANQMIQCPCQIVELEPINCKWPIGDPTADGFYFCGAIKFNGGPYCPEHHRLAHHPEPKHVRSRVPTEPVQFPCGTN